MANAELAARLKELDAASRRGEWVDLTETLVAHLPQIVEELERLEHVDLLLIDTLNFLAAMEMCHACSGTVLVDEGPVHCEDCPYDCEGHDGEPCDIQALHRSLQSKVRAYFEKAGKP